MGDIVDAIIEVFRDHNVDGMPSSGPYNPPKAEIRALGGVIENAIEAAAEGLVQTETWSDLSAITGTREGQPGRVAGTDASTHTDPVVGGTVNNEGEYSWSVSPAGWLRIGDRIDGDAIPAALNLGSLGVLSCTASVSGTTWTISWAGGRGTWNGAAIFFDDQTSTTLAASETIYVDLAGDTTPYQIVKATTSALLRGDFAAGRKLQLLGNLGGTLFGPLADVVRSSAALALVKQMTQGIYLAGAFDAFAARATDGSSTWTVSWQSARLMVGDAIATIDDLSITDVPSGNVLYIDLVSDTTPFQVVNAAIGGVLSDLAAGKKLALFYNRSGIPMGALALSVMQSTMKYLDPDKIVVQCQGGGSIYVYQKANPSYWVGDVANTATAYTYIRWKMGHVVDEDLFADVWQIQGVNEVVRRGLTSFTDVRELCDTGNFEIAANESGVGSSGGAAHGCEEFTDAVLLVDGRAFSVPLAVTAYKHGRNVSFLQRSNLYQKGTVTPNTVVNAEADRRYEWENGTLRLEQQLKFKRAYVLDYLMLGMFPVNRADPADAGFAITSAAYRLAPYLAEIIDNDAYASVESLSWVMKMQGPNDHTFEMEAEKGWDKPNRRMWIQSDETRNKGYLDFVGVGYNTAVDEIIVSRVRYRVQMFLDRNSFG